jgi:hypothetical protein
MFKVKRNSIKEVITFLEKNPFSTESEINEQVWSYFRNDTWESNKKYAEIIRRGLKAGKICRKEYSIGRSKFVYFLPNS